MPNSGGISYALFCLLFHVQVTAANLLDDKTLLIAVVAVVTFLACFLVLLVVICIYCLYRRIYKNTRREPSPRSDEIKEAPPANNVSASEDEETGPTSYQHHSSKQNPVYDSEDGEGYVLMRDGKNRDNYYEEINENKVFSKAYVKNEKRRNSKKSKPAETASEDESSEDEKPKKKHSTAAYENPPQPRRSLVKTAAYENPPEPRRASVKKYFEEIVDDKPKKKKKTKQLSETSESSAEETRKAREKKKDKALNQESSDQESSEEEKPKRKPSVVVKEQKRSQSRKEKIETKSPKHKKEVNPERGEDKYDEKPARDWARRQDEQRNSAPRDLNVVARPRRFTKMPDKDAQTYGLY